MLAAALSFRDLLNPEMIIQYGGVALLLVIIFAETGLFFGFFLPGDSLLFAAGLLCESKYLSTPVVVLIPLLILAVVLGSTVCYGFGRWAKHYLKRRKENFFYKKKYIEMRNTFYQKHGSMPFVLRRV